MSKEPLKTREAVEASREHPAWQSTGVQQSRVPIPLREGGRLSYGFFVGGAATFPQGVLLDPPDSMVVVTHEREIEVRPVASGTAIVGDGYDGLRPGQSQRTELTERSQLYDALDILGPAYAGRHPATPEVKGAAVAFKKLWPRVMEAPLSGHYDGALRDFRAWLR